MKRLLFILLLLPLFTFSQQPLVDDNGDILGDGSGDLLYIPDVDDVIMNLTPAVWYRADDVVLDGSLITQYNDKSGNGYNATQAVGSSQATQTIDANLGTTASFDGGDHYKTSASIFSITTSTVVAVVEWNTSGGFTTLFDDDDTNNEVSLIFNGVSKYGIWINGSGAYMASTILPIPTYVVGYYSSGSDSVNVAGLTETVLSGTPDAFDGLTFGGDAANSQRFRGKVSDFILFDYTLSDAELLDIVTNYINVKYNL